MFLIRRPSVVEIGEFVERSRELPLSYGPAGIVRHPPGRMRLDDQVVRVGRGDADFERARHAIATWAQFAVGWVDIFPRGAPVEPGTVVALLIRHLGFWSLNGARVVERISQTGDRRSFGFVYGTLTNHAEHGEELFEVSMDPNTGDVLYRIRAVSAPQSSLATLGLPFARVLQARFRRDSAAGLKRAVSTGPVGA